MGIPGISQEPDSAERQNQQQAVDAEAHRRLFAGGGIQNSPPPDVLCRQLQTDGAQWVGLRYIVTRFNPSKYHNPMGIPDVPPRRTTWVLTAGMWWQVENDTSWQDLLSI